MPSIIQTARMPHQLDFLQVCFDGEIARHELPALRGAISKKAGFKQPASQPQGSNDFQHGYPLIQYKRIYHHPALVCVGESVETMYRLINEHEWSLDISGRTLSLALTSLNRSQHLLEVTDKCHRFRIGHWLAIPAAMQQQFLALPSDADRIACLQRKLIGNILSFAKGIGWFVEKAIEVTIHAVERVQSVPHNGDFVLAFDVDFSTNVSLPTYIGLGKATSLGNGILRPYRDVVRIATQHDAMRTETESPRPALGRLGLEKTRLRNQAKQQGAMQHLPLSEA